MNTLDLIVIIIYLAAALTIGVLVGWRETADDFFVNRRRTKTWLLMFTVISTSIGTASVIGLAGESYATGISLLLSAIGISAGSWLVVAFVAPRIKAFGDRHQAYTLGDFFTIRYSRETGILAGIVIFISYLLFLALQFVGAATVIRSIGFVGFDVALLVTATITVFYTAMAGIKSDFYTDALQFVVMMVAFLAAVSATTARLGSINVFRSLPVSHLDPFAFGGAAFFFGSILLGAALGIVGMEVWQRIYAASDSRSARSTFLWAALINTLFFLAPAFLGLAARRLFADLPKDLVLLEIMKATLPPGLLGLGFAGIFAALMSTVDSMIVVGTATWTKDFYARFFRPAASPEELLRIGRLTALLFGAGGLMLAFFFRDIIQLAITASSILLIFAPAIVGGLYWPRASAAAAFWSILLGFLATVGLLPIMPKIAFLPGFIISLMSFITILLMGTRRPQLA